MAIRNLGKKVKIGVIQVDHVLNESMESKQEQLIELAEKCLEEGAELVFFPEAFQYTGCREIKNDPEKLVAVSSAWKERCSALAKKYNAYVVPWDYEYCDGKVYNSSYILDRNGVEVGRYRKCQLTYSEEIVGGLTPGDEIPVFDLDIGKVGIMICFDNYFPETARVLGLKGAELVLYPLYGDTLNPQWEIKMKSRAIDNSMYVAPCQIDMINGIREGISYSGIVDPAGHTICRLTEKKSYQVVEIIMGKQVLTHTNGAVEDIRQYLLCQRNPKAYGEIVAEKKNLWAWDDIYDREDLIKRYGK